MPKLDPRRPAEMSIAPSMAVYLLASILAAGLWHMPAAAQSSPISGVWQSGVEGIPSGTGPEVSASDVQTLQLSQDGQYRREITVEGGDGRIGAGGKIIDSGFYRFTPPTTFEYRRSSWLVCTFGGCLPGQPIGANAGTLTFQLTAPGRAIFLGLPWLKVR